MTSRRHTQILSVATLLALGLTACGTGTTADSSAESAPTPSPIARADDVSTAVGEPSGKVVEEGSRTPRLAITHDAGVIVLDAVTLELLGEFPLEGFTRLNPVGDDRHLMVTEGEGFRVLDLGGYSVPHGDHDHHHSTRPTLTEMTFAAKHPGHVVVHDGRTVLYGDGDGSIRSFDSDALRDGATDKPEVTTRTERTPHHGVAVEREDGSVVTTVGTEDERSGIVIRDAKGKTLASSDECPGVHGEAAARGGALVFGCEDGLLLVKGEQITKVDAPDDYGRIGNQAGSEESPFVLGDYKTDPDAELERPKQVSITDTRDGSLRLVDLPASYSFRSLERGPDGEGVVLGTDGKLHVIDMAKGEVSRSIDVVEEWTEPTDWQQPRPTVHVQDGTAYVTEPGSKALHMVDLHSGEVVSSGELPVVPNEIDGTLG
ncbi:zinc metallochaperone AztD [Janibacter indicus]